jgi:hypothetical protein
MGVSSCKNWGIDYLPLLVLFKVYIKLYNVSALNVFVKVHIAYLAAPIGELCVGWIVVNF